MPTEFESAIDCRIAAKKNFTVYAGETWKLKINVLDKANNVIDLSTFSLGLFRLYDKTTGSLFQTIGGVQISDGSIVIDQDIAENIKVNMGSGYYYKLPIIPVNGAKAILHGTIFVDGRD